jgi:hypothetical protein
MENVKDLLRLISPSFLKNAFSLIFNIEHIHPIGELYYKCTIINDTCKEIHCVLKRIGGSEVFFQPKSGRNGDVEKLIGPKR